MLWCQNEGGERNGSGRICERWAKIPVKTFQSRKESILNCLLIGSGGFIYKSKGGIGSARSDQEISDIFEEGEKYWREITVAGVNTAAACVGELTITWKGSLTTAACLK